MRAIVFDLDGTLIDSQEDVLSSFRHAFDGLGLPCPGDGALLSVIGVSLEECFLPFVGGDATLAREGTRIFRAWYEDHHLDATKPYPGIEALLKALSPAVPMAVCTMKKGFYARRLVTALGWDPVFRGVVAAEEGLPPKPDPAMLLAACRLVKAAPEETLYVGDTAVDGRAARAAGMPFAFASWGYGTLESLRDIPRVAVLGSPEEVLGFEGVLRES